MLICACMVCVCVCVCVCARVCVCVCVLMSVCSIKDPDPKEYLMQNIDKASYLVEICHYPIIVFTFILFYFRSAEFGNAL